MSMRVLIRDYPNRAIALVSQTHALIFRYSSSGNDVAIINGTRTSLDAQNNQRCMVEFSRLKAVDLSDYRTLNPRPVYGTLGLITIENDVFLCIVTGAAQVATVRPDETVQRLYAVEFYCLSSNKYDNVISDAIDPYGSDRRDEDDYSYGQSLSQRDSVAVHPGAELQKMLSNGSFYYSSDFDLTNRLQDRAAESTTFDIDNLDESFLWNSFMIAPLVKFRSQMVDHEREELDAQRFLTSVIRGFVLTMTIPNHLSPIRAKNSGLPSSLTLISRLSCRRAGTRFNSRGIDDDGNVANFVETETIYWSPEGVCFSYAQVRGSVPVFWEQATHILPNKQSINLTRSKEGTQPAFDKHFEDLAKSYGSVHVVNLLSETKQGESDLTSRYRYGVQHCSLNTRDKGHEEVSETEFDFHAETKSGFEAAIAIRHLITRSADLFQYYLVEEREDGGDDDDERQRPQRRATVDIQQSGVFRTNCLDCLDRTNLIQTLISKMALDMFLLHMGVTASPDFWTRHSSLWADNGDALSRIYAGTGALKTSFTRHGKMSLAGAFADARKSATRIYINNFADKGRQNTIDVLLGRLLGQQPVQLFDPLSDYVNGELQKRIAEYSSTKDINIWVGTYNVNGRSDGARGDLRPWLFPFEETDPLPDMYVVGFQEIVDLSPQQIMSSDPTRKREWERSVKSQLNKQCEIRGLQDRYVRLRSGQLVGAALCIYVKSSVLPLIKHVEGAVKKTGLSGMAGNKGAVAIRMQFASTEMCFVTAHLAAGFANYDERNKDFQTINSGLRFQRNRSIDDHDTIVWLGDFNYRIGMSADRVKSLFHQDTLENLQKLYENDQLNIQMVAGLTFPHYNEAMIKFKPTYKFDVGTDTYDTSEKARIPAWTDRILRKGSNIRQIAYHSANLRYSDHKPVYATFECTVSIVDEVTKAKLSERLFEKRRREVGGAGGIIDRDSEDEDLIDTHNEVFESVEPGLPPASSERKKWWLEGGMPAKSQIKPPEPGMVPSPNRSVNPWQKNGEPDWIMVKRPTPPPRRASTMSQMSSPSEATQQPPRRAGTGLSQPAANGAPSPIAPSSAASRRKLPPPFAASPQARRHERDPHTPVLPSRVDTDSPRLPPRPGSVSEPQSPALSTTSSTARKPAPPVARKPRHLSGTPPVEQRGRLDSIPRKDVASPQPPPPRRSGGASGAAKPVDLLSEESEEVMKLQSYLALKPH